MRQVNLVIAVHACHFVYFVVLRLDCRVRSNDKFPLLTVFERRKVNCEFADSQLAHYPDPHCMSVGNVRAASLQVYLQVCESASLRVCEFASLFWIFRNKAEYWISKNRIMDIQKSNNGYQKIELWISKNLAEFWISISRFLDIHKSIFGYP